MRGFSPNARKKREQQGDEAEEGEGDNCATKQIDTPKQQNSVAQLSSSSPSSCARSLATLSVVLNAETVV